MYFRKHSRMKKLPQHSNLLKIESAIIDKVPVHLPYSFNYSAALPLEQGGIARSTTMFLVMKKYVLLLLVIICLHLNSVINN